MAWVRSLLRYRDSAAVSTFCFRLKWAQASVARIFYSTVDLFLLGFNFFFLSCHLLRSLFFPTPYLRGLDQPPLHFLSRLSPVWVPPRSHRCADRRYSTTPKIRVSQERDELRYLGPFIFRRSSHPSIVTSPSKLGLPCVVVCCRHAALKFGRLDVLTRGKKMFRQAESDCSSSP